MYTGVVEFLAVADLEENGLVEVGLEEDDLVVAGLMEADDIEMEALVSMLSLWEGKKQPSAEENKC